MQLPDRERIADALASEGWLVLPDWLDPATHDELLASARSRACAGALRPARVGRGEAVERLATIRGDAILWLEAEDECAAVARLLGLFDRLRCALNETLYLGLVETEAHFAHYPTGAGYQRHLDRFRSDDARTVSAVLHLGDPWQPAHGGELRIFLQGPDGETSIDLPPHPGQLVLFLSGEIEHEVLPTRRDRYSVAAWMRRRSAS